VARLPEDEDLLQAAHRVAGDLLAADPALQRPEHRALRERAVGRFPRAVDLFRTG
jgi:hypothetical protein